MIISFSKTLIEKIVYVIQKSSKRQPSASTTGTSRAECDDVAHHKLVAELAAAAVIGGSGHINLCAGCSDVADTVIVSATCKGACESGDKVFALIGLEMFSKTCESKPQCDDSVVLAVCAEHLKAFNAPQVESIGGSGGRHRVMMKILKK